MNKKSNIRYYCGGGAQIGASFSLISFDGYNFGMDWGGGYDSKIQEPKYTGLLDSLFITHAHYDHNGMVPCLARRFPNLIIYCTPPTFDISLYQWEQAVRNQGKNAPFSLDDIEATKKQIRIVQNGDEIKLKEKLSVFPRNSGHILGSSSLLIKNGNNHLTFFTSDISFQSRHLIKGAQMLDHRVDLLVRESTYCNTDFESREVIIDRFVNSVKEKLSRGSKILIPALSVDRLQDIYAVLKEGGIEAFIDSSSVINEIYAKYLGSKANFLLEANRFENRQDREDLFRSKGGAVIIASSGMVNRGTISSWWAEKLVPNRNNAIFTVNYMDPGSPGGELVSTDQGKFLVLNGITVKRNCDIQSFNFSAHMSRLDGLGLEIRLNPDHIIYGHYGSVDSVRNYISRQGNRRTRRTISKVGKWEDV